MEAKKVIEDDNVAVEKTAKTVESELEQKTLREALFESTARHDQTFIFPADLRLAVS